MVRATYEAEAHAERHHWWFEGRRKILGRLLDRLRPPLPVAARVLDVGCGTGANGPALAAGGRFVIGVDRSTVPLGLPGTGERGHAARIRGDIHGLPFADATFDLVTALDVLEHVDDDTAALAEVARVLRPTGTVVIFVPALRVLWGLQDEVSHHRRRYSRDELDALVRRVGLRPARTTFFNTLLFPPILLARLAMRVRRPAQVTSENQIGGPVSNAILKAIFSAEASLLDRIDLPIGVSLACVAHR